MADKFCACGKAISSNRDRCQKCVTADMALDDITAADLEGATHIIVKSEDDESLFRADGMQVGGRSGSMVVFGFERKEQASRFFINSTFSAAWLRKLAGLEMVASKGNLNLADVIESDDPAETVIIERDVSSSIILPSGTLSSILRH